MNKFYIGGIALFMIAIVTIAYQSLVVIPQQAIEQKEREARLQRQAEQLLREDRGYKYNACRASAYEVYSRNWDAQCEVAGKEADCTLNATQRGGIEAMYQRELETCVTMYK